MRSFAFCTAYVDEDRSHLTSARYSKWVLYYQPLLKELGAEHLFLIDDGSKHDDLLRIKGVSSILSAGNLPDTLKGQVTVVSFPDNLGGSSFLGWWRSFFYSATLAERYGFDKIIHIESDFYLLSARLRDFIKNVHHGWTSLYSRFYDFPEAALQVICKESFPRLIELSGQTRSRMEAEYTLPFTSVNKDFNGDRLGEFGVFQQWARQAEDDREIDYIAQLLPDINVLSSTELKHLFRSFNKRSAGYAEKDFDSMVADLKSIINTTNI